MTCPEVQQSLSLYLYGELPFAVEDELELHLGTCSACQLAYRREKDWHAAVQGESLDVPLPLLAECRQSLKAGLAATKAFSAKPTLSWRERWLSWLPRPVETWSGQMATVSMLLLAGFAAGRWMNGVSFPSLTQASSISVMGLWGPQDQVRDIRPEPNGQVRIIVDQINERQLVGGLQDNSIRQMVLAAAQNPEDPGLRVDSVAVLAGQAGLDIRNALLRSAREDANAAVRLKALEGLRSYSSDPEARAVVRSVLQYDDNPGVRSEAIDVLIPATQQVQMSPELARMLQEVMQVHGSDPYLRMRCLQILSAADVAPGVY